MFGLLKKASILSIVLTAVSYGSTASAQVPNPILLKCGGVLETNIATQSYPRDYTSTSYVKVQELGFFRPIGVASDCVTVTFSAEAACKGTAPGDRCYIRALHNGVPMNPKSKGARLFVSESETPSAHSLQWVSRGLFEGNNIFTIEVKVGRAGTSFYVDDWTMLVELLS